MSKRQAKKRGKKGGKKKVARRTNGTRTRLARSGIKATGAVLPVGEEGSIRVSEPVFNAVLQMLSQQSLGQAMNVWNTLNQCPVVDGDRLLPASIHRNLLGYIEQTNSIVQLYLTLSGRAPALPQTTAPAPQGATGNSATEDGRGAAP